MAKEFIFHNGKTAPKSAILCIDRFLISQELETWSGRIEATKSVRKLSITPP
jgi:hypothetical protein